MLLDFWRVYVIAKQIALVSVGVTGMLRRLIVACTEFCNTIVVVSILTEMSPELSTEAKVFQILGG